MSTNGGSRTSDFVLLRAVYRDDFDEYWIIVKGRGKAVTEGISYDILPGDCVATGMGHHHDLPQVFEFIQAVYFETTLEGQKRLGHLYNHADGPAHPKPERV